jgi:hypothetical protein
MEMAASYDGGASSGIAGSRLLLRCGCGRLLVELDILVLIIALASPRVAVGGLGDASSDDSDTRLPFVGDITVVVVDKVK